MTASVLDGVRDLLPTLRERAEETERLRVVPEASIKDLESTGFFRLLQPRRFDGFEARARGVRAILPHVDELRPVHNLQSVADLAQARHRVIASGGAHRAGAILAAMRRIGCHTLVTDEAAARAILKMVPSPIKLPTESAATASRPPGRWTSRSSASSTSPRRGPGPSSAGSAPPWTRSSAA